MRADAPNRFVINIQPDQRAGIAALFAAEGLPVPPIQPMIRGRMVAIDGKPAANLKVAIVPGGVRYRGVLKETAVTTDANGEFSVTWPMPQMYWINASYPPRVEVPEGQPRPPMPAKRYNYGGTFVVLPQ